MNPFAVQIDIGGNWHTCLFYGLSLCALYVFRRAPLPAYLSIWALYLLEYPGGQYGQFNLAYKATAGQALAEFLFPLAAVLSLRRAGTAWVLRAFRWVIVAHIILVWGNVGDLAQSMNTALIALYIPFAPPWLVGASLLTIFTHHGSTAQMIVIAYALLAFPKLWWCVVPGILGVAYFHSNGPWLDGSDRLLHWQKYMTWWAQDWRQVLVGTGPGSFQWLAPSIDEWQGPLFLFMHNDWLQILFELGVIGLALAVRFIYKALRHSISREERAAIIGACVFACTYSPLRFFLPAFLIALIFNRTIRCIAL